MSREERIEAITKEIERIEEKIYQLMREYVNSNDREEGHKIISKENELYDRMRQLKAVRGALSNERVASPLHKLSELQIDDVVNSTTYYLMREIEVIGKEILPQDLVSISNRVLDNLVQFYFDVED